MLTLKYEAGTNSVVTTCSNCGGKIVIKVGEGLAPSFLARILRIANTRLTDATSHCPGCERK
jgi:predicted RNA-binding Zn-ribbon protein involved in translation (DUF1610 family)